MSMIEQEIQKAILNGIKTTYPKAVISLGDILVEKINNPIHGDFSTNIAFKLARQLKKSPRDINFDLSMNIASPTFIENASYSEGFLNFKISNTYFQKEVETIIKENNRYADSEALKGKKIQVEFISANPTGPLTLANGRGGFSGDVLANVFKKAGYEVQREYYVNDGGNQVKTLGKSILAVAGFFKQEDDLYKGPYVEEWFSGNKDKVEASKDDPFALGVKAANDLLKNKIKPSVKNMNIDFDNWFSEKEMIEKGEVEEAIEKLKKHKLTYEKDGALWMRTTDFGDDKDRVLIKTDGEKTYFANDVAYHFDKLYKRGFNKVIDIWGADHHGYVGRMKAAVDAMGCPGALDVIITQMVRLIKDGKEFKISKRKGTYATVDELLEVIGGTKKEASDVVRFFFLSRNFNTHMDFDLDLAKERSEKNPVYYVKYAYARISGILRNAKDLKLPKSDLSKLSMPEEISLIKILKDIKNMPEQIINNNDYPVHELTFYVRDIASKFHAFYDKCRVIDEDNLGLSAARLKLVEATKIVLSIVMKDLIGIDTPEKM